MSGKNKTAFTFATDSATAASLPGTKLLVDTSSTCRTDDAPAQPAVTAFPSYTHLVSAGRLSWPDVTPSSALSSFRRQDAAAVASVAHEASPMNASPMNSHNESFGMAPPSSASYSVVSDRFPSTATGASTYGANSSSPVVSWLPPQQQSDQETWGALQWGGLHSNLHTGSLSLPVCASMPVTSPLVTTPVGHAGSPEDLDAGGFRRCIYFSSGGCRNGTACGFSHDTATQGAPSLAVPAALPDGMAGAYPGSFTSMQAPVTEATAAAVAAGTGVFATRSLMEALPSVEYHRHLVLAGNTITRASVQAGMKALPQSSMSSALVYPAPEGLDSHVSCINSSGSSGSGSISSSSTTTGVSTANMHQQLLLYAYRSDQGTVKGFKGAPLSPPPHAGLQQQQQEQVVTGQVASGQVDQMSGSAAVDEQPVTSEGDATQASSAAGAATLFKERPDLAPPCPQSRQIYMTFTADSVFAEQDVAGYFSKFGSVQEVRIPLQQKRMFGFVTFACQDSVKRVLDAPGPHTVNGCRVLVKRYREKARIAQRRLSMAESGSSSESKQPANSNNSNSSMQRTSSKGEAASHERAACKTPLPARFSLHDCSSDSCLSALDPPLHHSPIQRNLSQQAMTARQNHYQQQQQQQQQQHQHQHQQDHHHQHQQQQHQHAALTGVAVAAAAAAAQGTKSGPVPGAHASERLLLASRSAGALLTPAPTPASLPPHAANAPASVAGNRASVGRSPLATAGKPLLASSMTNPALHALGPAPPAPAPGAPATAAAAAAGARSAVTAGGGGGWFQRLADAEVEESLTGTNSSTTPKASSSSASSSSSEFDFLTGIDFNNILPDSPFTSPVMRGSAAATAATSTSLSRSGPLEYLPSSSFAHTSPSSSLFSSYTTTTAVRHDARLAASLSMGEPYFHISHGSTDKQHHQQHQQQQQALLQQQQLLQGRMKLYAAAASNSETMGGEGKLPLEIARTNMQSGGGGGGGGISSCCSTCAGDASKVLKCGHLLCSSCDLKGWNGMCLSCHRLLASNYTNTQNAGWYTAAAAATATAVPAPSSGGKLVGYPGAW